MANKYSVIKRSYKDLEHTLESLDDLGLLYFVFPCYKNGNGIVSVYIFFDKEGMGNYLAEIFLAAYDEVFDNEITK